ncbi:peptidoglycan DD-metalloendopeptidase family protein [Streptomyces lincolnensis]|uniref:peptidoglycan DD-metalloendopeptidase family protein n=1 Tax=Streptomyces lincolnensis TaxID=1915 RepID=UPI0037D27DE2
MPDLDIVGGAAVDVVPIVPNFHQKLKSAVLPIADRVGIEAGQKLGERMAETMRASLVGEGTRVGNALGDAIGDSMARQIATAIPNAVTNGGRTARAASTRQGDDNAGAFARAFENRLRTAFRSLPRPDVRLNDTGFNADLARLRARMETLSNKRIGVDIDEASALAEITAVDAALAQLGSRSPNVQVRTDIATARAELALIQRQINDVDRDDVRIRVTANTAQANAALLQLAVSLGIVAALPLVPIAAAGIGAIASAATVAVAGVGALTLAAIPAIKGVTSVIQAKTAAEKEAASATDNSAAANVRAAQNALQMATAQQALSAAHRNAGRSIAQANRQVEDAERALGQAAARAMEQRAQAAENVERAEESLTDAKRSALRAEMDLAQARADAARTLAGLNDELERGKLDEREATLRVQEAQEELNRVQAEYDAGTATELQLERAQLAYDQSVQSAKQQKKDFAQLQKDTEAARKAGVEGNDDVKDAAQRVADAQRNVQDQTEAVADAQREAARTQIESAQTVADAQRALSDAVTNAADTQVQAAESIASAERGIESARLSGINTTAQAATKADEYREALAKLTPEQRDLYDSLAGPKGLTAAFKAWSLELQPDVLPLFTRGVDGAKNSLPGLTPLVQNSADAIGELMDRASADMKRSFWQRFKQGVAENAKPAIVGLGVAFGNVFKGMAGVMDAFFPHMDSISERMQRITGRFANWGTGLRGSPEFEKFLAYVSEHAPMVGEAFGDMGEAIIDLAKALEPFSTVILELLGYAADAISYVVEKAPWAIQLIYGLWIATRLWNLAMASNPIGLIVLALVGLALAVKYAWDHYDWFREAVKSTWAGIQVATDFAWKKVLKPTFDGISAATQWVGDKLEWLWKDIFVPAWNGISFAARVAAAVLLTLVITPIWLAIQGLGLLLGWLWTDCFKPTWDGIAWLSTWVWNNALSPFFGWVWDGLKWVGAQFVWLYDHAVKPSADWISEKSNWLWTKALQPVFGFMWDGLKWVGDKFVWLYDHAVRPVADWIAEKSGWLYDKGLKPAFDNMKTAVGLVGAAFESAKKMIKSAWDSVADIVAQPINWIVQFAYTDGIKKVWDHVADFVGLDPLPDAPKLLKAPKKFADGGRTRGGIPGVDSILALLMEDEYVIRRDSARKIGFGVLESMNRTGQVPIQRFADGGLVGALSGAWDWTTDTVSGVAGTAVDWAKTGADLLVNPGKVWDQLLKPILKSLNSRLGESPLGDVIAKYPVKMASGLRDMVVDAATGMVAGDGGGNLGSGDWAKPVNAPLGTRFGVAGSMWSSGHHTGLDFPAATGTPVRAVDAGQVVGAASGGPYGNHLILNHGGGLSSLYAHLSRMAASIGDAVTRGQVIGAVGATGNITGPHLHLEARQNGRAIDPMPFLYDDGGYLQPGMNLVANGTGKPEPVFTSGQWSDIRATKSGGPATVHADVRVFVGDREITDIVRTEINTYDKESADGLTYGRYV